jgi:hypothetical protein
MPSIFPDQGDDYPVMLILTRDGRELAASTAVDGHAAVKEAARLILTQEVLYVGMQLVAVRHSVGAKVAVS